MLSVFITPWMKPTFIHCAISAPAAAPPRSRLQERRSGIRRARGRGARWRSRPGGAGAGSPRRRRTGRCRHAGGWPPRASAPRAGQRVAVTAAGGRHRQSARVVGMPSACMARPPAPQASARPRPCRRRRARHRAARALEGDVAGAGVLGRPARPAAARPSPSCGEAAELVAGVGLGDRLRVAGQCVAGEDRRGVVGTRSAAGSSQLPRERVVEKKGSRSASTMRLPARRSAGRLADVGSGRSQRRSYRQCAGDGLAPWLRRLLRQLPARAGAAQPLRIEAPQACRASSTAAHRRAARRSAAGP